MANDLMVFVAPGGLVAEEWSELALAPATEAELGTAIAGEVPVDHYVAVVQLHDGGVALLCEPGGERFSGRVVRSAEGRIRFGMAPSPTSSLWVGSGVVGASGVEIAGFGLAGVGEAIVDVPDSEMVFTAHATDVARKGVVESLESEPADAQPFRQTESGSPDPDAMLHDDVTVVDLPTPGGPPPLFVPTPEEIPLMLPNSTNPRYSYGGSKIASELIAMNYAQDHFKKLQIFRPHNVYGPNMGWKHVLPQFLLRAAAALETSNGASTPFPIQGDGSETRAFAYVDDVVDGILTMYANGGHREIYHIGNDEEIAIRRLVEIVGETLGGTLEIQPGEATVGGTPRRCPDLSKMRAIGYDPKVGLIDGVKRTADWYMANRDVAPENELL